MLGLYKLDPQTGNFVRYTTTDDPDPLANPISTPHNGIDGQTVVTRLFLRNDDETKYYTGLSIFPIPEDDAGPDNVTGWTFKLLSGDTAPSNTDWSARISGAVINSVPDYTDPGGPVRYFIPEIGSSTASDLSYLPIWYQVSVPAGTGIQISTAIKLNISFTENAV